MESPSNYTPFNMDCARCEHELTCFFLLKYLHHVFGMECRQGRKRKVIRQSTIAEVLEKYNEKHVDVPA